MLESSDASATVKSLLLAQLRQRRWPPGAKMPTERQICALHSVGRAAVRRALAELKELGLITQTVGSGTYVAQDIANRLPELPQNELAISPAELMEARIIFEPALVDLIVRNGTTADFAALDHCCRNADAAQSLEQFERWDSTFHRTLAEATHNGFVMKVFDLISTVRDHGEWGLLKRRSATPERRDVYQREHWALHAALRNRDSETAREVLVGHLVNVKRNMFD